MKWEPYDMTDEDVQYEWECIDEQLSNMIDSLFRNDDRLNMKGHLGLWDGDKPIAGTVDAEEFRHNIVVPHDNFELYLITEDELDMSAGTLQLVGHHHDGINIVGFRHSDDSAITHEDLGY